jgi:hypothetical protein
MNSFYFFIVYCALLHEIHLCYSEQSIDKCNGNKYVPFLWNSTEVASKSQWFEVYPLNESTTLSESSNKERVPPVYLIEPELLVLKCEKYQIKCKNIFNNMINNTYIRFDKSFYDYFHQSHVVESKKRSMAVFHNVKVDHQGVIIDQNSCKAIRNGGLNKFRKFNYNGYPEIAHDNVITLASGAIGTWHFPMEVLVALAGLDPKFISKSIIHLSKRSAYMSEWLKVVGVSFSKIIYNAVRVQTLYVPQMGRYSFPYSSQLYWLRDKLLTKENSNRERLIILINRRTERVLDNYPEVSHVVNKFAIQHGYRVYIHDDGNLPTIREQIDIFAHASIIVANHGAGTLFTAFSPMDSCLIEFLKKNEPLCYAHNSYFLHQNYIGNIMDKGSNGGRKMSLKKLQQSLDKCNSLW